MAATRTNLGLAIIASTNMMVNPVNYCTMHSLGFVNGDIVEID